MNAVRLRGRVARVVPVLALMVVLAACNRESRSLAADLPQTPPNGPADPRIAQYRDNAYQVAQGGRYYVWYGCGDCHDGDERMRLIGPGGQSFVSTYQALEKRHRGAVADVVRRMPVEQRWQITASLQESAGQELEKLKRHRSDTVGEPRGARWAGPVR